MQLLDRFYRIAKKFYPYNSRLIAQVDINHIAPDTELSPFKINIIPLILHINKPGYYLIPSNSHPSLYLKRHLPVLFRHPYAVYARYTRHDYYIITRKQRSCGRKPKPINILIYGGILRYICICLRKIAFRLIIVIVADKILHRIIGEEFLEFVVELRRKCLVMGYYKHRPLPSGYCIGYSESLSRTCNAKQCLMLLTIQKTRDQRIYRFRLITLWSK